MLILALAVPGLTAAEPEGEWVKSSGEGYEILFPAKPVEKSGKITSLTELGRGPGKKLTLRIDANVQPLNTADVAQMKKLFDIARDTTVKSQKDAKVVADKDITIGKHPGRDIDFEFPKYFNRLRVVKTPAKSYLISIVGPKDYVDGPEVKKFLESFKIKV